MIILGIILLIIGYFWIRPLVWVGGALIILGLILYLAEATGPFAGHYY